MLDEYAVAQLCLDELERFRDPHTGATFSDEASALRGHGIVDLGIQGAPLYAYVAAGDLPKAVAAERFLRRLLDEQSDSTERLYCFYDTRKGPVTDFAENLRVQGCLERGRTAQPHANLGLSISALAKLYEATGNAEFLETAQGFMAFELGCRDDLVTHAQNHKVGWAAALLWRHTRRDVYHDLAVAIADKVARSLLPDGRAVADIVFERVEEQSLYVTVRSTCDAALWLRMTADELDAVG
jgi:hypothetical protein